MAQQIQLRRDTGANWSSVNPVLAQGELGVNLTTGAFKTGDGSTAWNSLPYVANNVLSVFGRTGTITAQSGDYTPTQIGATTVGAAFFGLANPSAITFPRINADNTVTALSASSFRTAIGAGTSSFDGTWSSLSGKPANVVSFGSLANGAGWLFNDGAGALSYSSPTKSTVGLGSVENTALSTWSGSANVTTLGTVTTGTWNATAIADGKIASALTGKTYNGLTPTAQATGFTLAGGTTSKTLTVSGDATVNQSVATTSSPTFFAFRVTGGTGGGYVNQGGDSAIYFSGGASYAGYSGDYQFLAQATNAQGILMESGVIQIWSNTGLTVGNNFTPTRRISVSSSGAVRFNSYGAGTLVTDSSGNITASSDGRLKDVTGKFTRGLDAILQLEPKTFTWKTSSGMNTEDLNVGFIAQDVQSSIPEAVGSVKTRDVEEIDSKTGKKTKTTRRETAEFLSLSDRPIIAALVNAVKELNDKVEKLSKKNA